MELQTGYLIGCWQTEKYFKSIRKEILKEFKIDLSNDVINKKLKEEISQCNSVSIHIRRGDYLTDREAKILLGGVVTLEYYKKAIELIKERVKNPHFYVFSDDMDWVRKNFKEEKMTLVEVNKGEKSYIDMFLMSQCKHNIIVNSSFSWWGAWLNTNIGKIVIAPNRWFNGGQPPDILPEEWIKVAAK